MTTDRENKGPSDTPSPTPRERAGQSSDQDSIIPGRHGKHGGSEESEGAPQDETPEATPPTERDDANRARR
jgi:hypothetical protein